jgi:hypothetical protein
MMQDSSSIMRLMLLFQDSSIMRLMLLFQDSIRDMRSVRDFANGRPARTMIGVLISGLLACGQSAAAVTHFRVLVRFRQSEIHGASPTFSNPFLLIPILL